MKLRELINRLEEISNNGNNDNLNIIIESDITISDYISDINLRKSLTGKTNVVIEVINL